MKVFIIIVIVAGALIGMLFTLRSSKDAGTPSAEVLERAKQRSREQAEKDKAD